MLVEEGNTAAMTEIYKRVSSRLGERGTCRGRGPQIAGSGDVNLAQQRDGRDRNHVLNQDLMARTIYTERTLEEL